MAEPKDKKEYPMLSVRMSPRLIDDINECSANMHMKVPQFIRYVLMEWCSSSKK
jgi:hypothetical protein